MEKLKILAITSNFGLGPVGKLASIVNATKNVYEWYATGQVFDLNIFGGNPFKEIFFTDNEEDLIKYVKNHSINLAVVVLKNKYGRLLKSIGVKVIYIDSLPFMWTTEDFKGGKIPLNMDYYCAQKSFELDDKHKAMFKCVKNLKWIDPIVPILTENEINQVVMQNNIIINVGGLHSPHGDGSAYVMLVIKPLVKILLNTYSYNIIITCSNTAIQTLNANINNNRVRACTLNQKQFLQYVKNSFLFFSSPGLTTIYETLNLDVPINLLPPQNLSQFYNAEFAMKNYPCCKILEWNDSILNLNNLSMIDEEEKFVVKIIYDRIKLLANEKEYIKVLYNNMKDFLDREYHHNQNCKVKNGTEEIIKLIEQIKNT